MINIEPVTGVIGAEVSGVDVASPLDGETISRIRQALLDHQVIFLKNKKKMTKKKNMRFKKYLGKVEPIFFAPKKKKKHHKMPAQKKKRGQKKETPAANWH